MRRKLSMMGRLWAALLVFLVACGPGASAPENPSDETPPGTEDPSDPPPPGDNGGGSGPGDGTTPKVTLRIDRMTPSRGRTAGGTLVVLTGRGFAEGFAKTGGRQASDQTSILFGSNPSLDINVIDDDTLEVRSPAGVVGTVDVKLENPNGSFVCKDCYRFFEPIVFTRVAPNAGATQGGDEVTLTGSGFTNDVLVLFGGTAATGLDASPDGKTMVVRTPPGASGSVDVTVVGLQSAAVLPRGFAYRARKRVSSVDPASSPLMGGSRVTVRGEAFGMDATVWFGDEQADVEYVSDTELVATVPPQTEAGAVDVVVVDRQGEATLPKGFSYFDLLRDVRIYTLSPRQGPVAGGSCAEGPNTCLVLTGAGFSGAGLQVKVGRTLAQTRVLSDNLVEVDLPPAAAGPGVVDVQARTARGGAELVDAFAYVVPVEVTRVSPDRANVSGEPAVVATITGSGFFDGCRAFFGPVPAEVTQTTASQLSVRVPAASAGTVDVRVECGDASELSFQSVSLERAFTFEEALSLRQVEPETGAQAGNTAVSLYGTGFLPGLDIRFGALPASRVEVKGPHLAVARSPKGVPGPVDVTVRQGGAEATLPDAFTYQNPVSVSGGGSGGPMQGVLNVSVLNSTPYMKGPVSGATISINDDQLVGTTDDRGQVTFSDPLLLKAVTITGSKPKWAVSTIARIDARNVTLFMQMNEGEGDPDPQQPPPPPEPASFTGRVCGFKTAPGFVLKPGQRLEARVYMTSPHVYSAPPFGSKGTPSVVTENCGTYSIATRRFGSIAFYAEFGVRDDSTSPPAFTPLLMGIRRGMSASAGKRLTEQDIILDMHRDLSIPIKIESAAAPAGRGVQNTVYSYLDLGGEGVVSLAEMKTTASEFVFESHPRVSGEGLLFLNMAAVYDPTVGTSSPPYSFFYRRQYGDPTAGVDIGPMLAFTRVTTPQPSGTFTGKLGWSFTEGRKPDVTQVFVEQPAGFSSMPIWDVVLPGTELGVSLPHSAVTGATPGSMLYWTLMTARSPRFEYDRFSFQQLSITSWTSFTQDYGSFRAP